jgi:hypothetical protein
MNGEVSPDAGRAMAAHLDRTEVAEQIIAEMARRQGHTVGPYFDWSLATEDFKARFAAAFAQRTSGQSPEDFARTFVDAWPLGMAAQRVIPDARDPIANPPYSRDGLWPAFLADRE